MRVHHVALAVTDLPAAEAFYTGVLALAVTARGERSIWLDLDGAILMLEQQESCTCAIPTGTASGSRITPW